MEDAVDVAAEQEANAAAVGRRRRVRISEDFKRVRLYEDGGSPPPHAYVVPDVPNTQEEEDVNENDMYMPSPKECLYPL